jgi:hypothetical protein
MLKDCFGSERRIAYLILKDFEAAHFFFIRLAADCFHKRIHLYK